MACGRSDHVGQEVGVEEDALANGDDQPVEDAGVPQLQEEEKVHTLILSLLEQVMDPAMVTLKSTQAAQVPLHSSNHSRYTSDSL